MLIVFLLSRSALYRLRPLRSAESALQLCVFVYVGLMRDKVIAYERHAKMRCPHIAEHYKRFPATDFFES